MQSLYARHLSTFFGLLHPISNKNRHPVFCEQNIAGPDKTYPLFLEEREAPRAGTKKWTRLSYLTGNKARVRIILEIPASSHLNMNPTTMIIKQ
jgi:hypothetical protein